MNKFGLILLFAYIRMITMCATAQAYTLPDTGQTSCYGTVSPWAETDCEGTGQDGNYDINPMSYTSNVNGTVTDNITGLIWQKCSVGYKNDDTCSEYDLGDPDAPDTEYNWYEASGTPHATYNKESISVCGDLELGGHNDWRLPTINELRSIINYSKSEPGPTIAAVFPNTQALYYWAATASAQDTDYAWFVDFYNGRINSLPSSGTNYVRCVRGVQLVNPSFTDNGDGTVTDSAAGLMWQKGYAYNKTWGSALEYCNNELVLPANNSYTDWRLPNIKELMSMIDHNLSDTAIDLTYFPYSSAFYISSTTYATSTGSAWSVDFSNGYAMGYGKSTHRVRCVRGACANKQVKVGDEAVAAYDNIQDAYNEASSTDTIRAQATSLDDNLLFAGNKTITLIGGFDCGFATSSGLTTVNGLTIGGTDKVTIANIIIK
jgi:hypothetical protein